MHKPTRARAEGPGGFLSSREETASQNARPSPDVGNPDLGSPDLGMTRREILAGVAATALIAGVPSVAKGAGRGRGQAATAVPTDVPLHRYMAASAILGDGRILIAGGYGRRWTGSAAPPPLNSAIIVDPYSGSWTAASPMIVPRARHAAVTLRDGRIAMIGGIGIRPTASVEIYDPRTDTWHVAASLAQPRYDHTAVSNGDDVFILGGSSHSMVSGVEVFRPATNSVISTEP
jgi:hypothetical protein